MAASSPSGRQTIRLIMGHFQGFDDLMMARHYWRAVPPYVVDDILRANIAWRLYSVHENASSLDGPTAIGAPEILFMTNMLANDFPRDGVEPYRRGWPRLVAPQLGVCRCGASFSVLEPLLPFERHLVTAAKRTVLCHCYYGNCSKLGCEYRTAASFTFSQPLDGGTMTRSLEIVREYLKPFENLRYGDLAKEILVPVDVIESMLVFRSRQFERMVDLYLAKPYSKDESLYIHGSWSAYDFDVGHILTLGPAALLAMGIPPKGLKCEQLIVLIIRKLMTRTAPRKRDRDE